MMRRLPLVIALVALTLFGSVGLRAVQDGRRVPPPPRGMAGGLPAGDSGTDWSPPGSTPRPAGTPGTTESSRLEAAIVTLTRQIDEARPVTATSITPLPALDRVEADAARYRRAYEAMSDRLYMGDPSAGSSAEQQFVEFDRMWGGVAADIWTGNRTGATMRAAEWDALVRRVRGAACPIGGAITDRVVDRILTGAEWACLSDAYFADVADFEVRTIRDTSDARARAVAPLGTALGALDSWLGRTAALRRLVPDNADLRREGAWLLHQVWLAGATARRNEFTRLFGRTKDTPFQRFLTHAPAVDRPPAPDVTAVVVPAGQALSVRLGSSVRAARVVPKPLGPGAALAAELHDIHFRTRIIGPRLSDADALTLRQRRAAVLNRIAGL